MILSIVKGASILGVAAIGTSAVLQWGYRTFDFYPPNAVYVFFTAALAYGLVEAVEHFSGKELLETGHELPTS
tara:strand:+ start:152 stop:370 length:219 start_codon:yes stop_codon:yes gene_type:complete